MNCELLIWWIPHWNWICFYTYLAYLELFTESKNAASTAQSLIYLNMARFSKGQKRPSKTSFTLLENTNFSKNRGYRPIYSQWRKNSSLHNSSFIDLEYDAILIRNVKEQDYKQIGYEMNGFLFTPETRSMWHGNVEFKQTYPSVWNITDS